MAEKLRWGILGTGNIARQFSVGLLSARRGHATAVGSRKKQTADEFARLHRIPISHPTYEALIADPEVDVIYNSIPNSGHKEWTIKALQAGKHVLCEKPLAMNTAEAEEMFDVADKSGTVLVEAFMYRSHPLTHEVLAAVRSGVIGDLKLIRTSFCYRTKKIAENVRFNRKLGGGGLMDIGCYCINYARLFTEAEPESVHAIAQFHETGVDDLMAGMMVFPGGVLSTFTCAMGTQANNTAQLCGTEGYIEVPVPWKPPRDRATYIITKAVPPRMDDANAAPVAPQRDIRHVNVGSDLYAIEADNFAATIFDGAPPLVTKRDSIGNMRVLDEMRRQIGLQF